VTAPYGQMLSRASPQFVVRPPCGDSRPFGIIPREDMIGYLAGSLLITRREETDVIDVSTLPAIPAPPSGSSIPPFRHSDAQRQWARSAAAVAAVLSSWPRPTACCRAAGELSSFRSRQQRPAPRASCRRNIGHSGARARQANSMPTGRPSGPARPAKTTTASSAEAMRALATSPAMA
jgi:hypothetical protein